MITKNIVKSNKMGAVQGDVPILKIETLTPNGEPTTTRIVAYGEATGHHHAIMGECEVLEVERDIAGRFFKGFEVIVTDGNPVHLYHKSEGEHDTIELLPGFYFIPLDIQQVEYDGENERRVLD